MPVIEEVRYALRKRLLSTGIITAAELQLEGRNAPANADFYIRETINTLDTTVNFQNGILHEYLVTYDIFADRKVFAGITSKLYTAADTITAEFCGTGDWKIDLPELPNCQAYLSRLVQIGTIRQEADLFYLAVQLYVNVQESK